MFCLHCRKQIEPVDHNNRGPRCPSCWERVVVEEEKPKAKARPAATRARKSKAS